MVEDPIAATDTGYEIIKEDHGGFHTAYKIAFQRAETNKGFKAATHFLIRAPWAPCPADAHAYLLANNTIQVGSKRAANHLVSTINQLRRTDHLSAFVYGVKVEVPLDEPWKLPKRQEWETPPTTPEHPCGEDDDFEPGDGQGRIGLRAYRILKPLLELPPRLQKINIIIQAWHLGDTLWAIYQGVGQKNPGLPLVAAVIAKLKARLAPGMMEYEELDERGKMKDRSFYGSRSSSMSITSEDHFYMTKNFRVGFRSYEPGKWANFASVDEGHDIDWLWKVPSDEEMARMEQYHPITTKDYKEAEREKWGLANTLTRLKNDPEVRQPHTRVALERPELAKISTIQQKKERIQADLAEVRGKAKDMQLYERC